MPLKIGTTKLNEAFQCLKKYEYHDRLKLIPKAHMIGPALRRGIWIHSCLEVESKGGDWPVRLDELVTWARSKGVDPEQIAKIESETNMVMTGYDHYWASQPQAKIGQSLITETALTLKVPSLDVEFTATVDRVAEYKGGIALVEYKSTAHIPPANWRAVDPQTAIQFMACRQNGIKVDRIVFDYLLTTPPPIPQVVKGGLFSTRKITTTTAAFDSALSGLIHVDDIYIEQMRNALVSDGKFYQRYDVLRPEHYLRETAKDLKAIVGIIRLAEKTGHWPRSFNPVMCTRMCSYSNLCSIEYMSGRESSLRGVEYELDNGQREGTLDPLSLSLQNVDLDDEF